jgi:hypothetical protein
MMRLMYIPAFFLLDVSYEVVFMYIDDRLSARKTTFVSFIYHAYVSNHVRAVLLDHCLLKLRELVLPESNAI